MCLGWAAGVIEFAAPCKASAQNCNLRYCPLSVQSDSIISLGWGTNCKGYRVQPLFTATGRESIFLYSECRCNLVGVLACSADFQGGIFGSFRWFAVSVENALAKIGFWRYNRNDNEKEVRL